jgi:hypothetical protein
VNGSQSKFLDRTWLISQNQPDVPLLLLGQDRIAIKKSSALRTRLGTMKTQQKTTIDARQGTCETTVAKTESKGSSSPHRHFTEHLMGVLRSTRESH